MSDDELDREWKPSGRPQSTLARSFSAALTDLFKIDNSVADLDAAVEQKKRAVSNQTSELEALEARLKATEERLKQRQSGINFRTSSPGSPSSRRRAPLADTFAGQQHNDQPQPYPTSPPRNTNSPLSSEFRPRTANRPQTANRPPTGRKDSPFTAPPIPGAMPPTPGASEGESAESDEEGERSSADYVVVTKDGDFPPPIPLPRNVNRPAT